MPPEGAARPPFRKILYERHYPDNYVDSSFLAGLRVNEGQHQLNKTYWELLVSTIPVVQHLASVFTFAAVFAQLYEERITPELMMWTTGVSTVGGYMIWEAMVPGRSLHRSRALLLAFVLPLLLVLLSPVLKALTLSTTSDTIWTLAGVLLSFNALLANHSNEPRTLKSGDGFPAALSLNAAMCAGTVLASRLEAHAAVASLFLFAGAWFALLPSVRHIAFAPVELALCVMAFLPLGGGLATAVMGLLLLVAFGAPLALLQANLHKDELKGPWTEAVPHP